MDIVSKNVWNLFLNSLLQRMEWVKIATGHELIGSSCAWTEVDAFSWPQISKPWEQTKNLCLSDKRFDHQSTTRMDTSAIFKTSQPKPCYKNRKEGKNSNNHNPTHLFYCSLVVAESTTTVDEITDHSAWSVHNYMTWLCIATDDTYGIRTLVTKTLSVCGKMSNFLQKLNYPSEPIGVYRPADFYYPPLALSKNSQSTYPHLSVVRDGVLDGSDEGRKINS